MTSSRYWTVLMLAGFLCAALAPGAVAGDAGGDADGTTESDAAEAPPEGPAASGTEKPQSLGDVLSGAEGVRVATMCTNCNVANVTMCGQTGDRVQVWQDGLPVVGGLGAVYLLSIMPAEAVARTDIIRGAGTVLSGPEAGVGALVLRTEIPGREPGLFGAVDFGSYGWGSQKVVASRRWGWFGAGAVLTHASSDGVDSEPKDGVFDLPVFDRSTAGGTATFHIGNRSVARLDGLIYREEQRMGKGGYAGPLDPVEPGLFHREDVDIRRDQYDGGFEHEFADGSRLTARGRYARREQDTSDDSIPVAGDGGLSRYMTVEEFGTMGETRYERTLLGRHTLAAGVSYTEIGVDGVSTKTSFLFPWGQAIDDRIEQKGVFLETGWALPARFDVTVGLRGDRLELSGSRLRPFQFGDTAPRVETYSSRRSRLQPRLRIAWKALDALALSLSAGDAFAPPRPSFERVCCGAIVLSNAGVVPETSRNYLLEADVLPARWIRVRPSIFRHDVENYIQKILWATSPNLIGNYTQVNYAEVTVQGAELSAELSFLDRLFVSLDATWLEAEAEETEVGISFYGSPLPLFDLPAGGEIPMLPRKQAAVVAKYDDKTRGLLASVQAQHTGSMWIQHATSPIGIGAGALEFVKTPSFWVVNARVEKTIVRDLKVFAGMDNMTDKVQRWLPNAKYEYNWGPLRGRYGYAGVSWEF